MSAQERAAEVRFWSHVDKADGCWTWTASLRGDGYGSFWVNGRTVLAHRQAYIWAHGELPEGMVLDHLCRNRRCVRPDHLEPVTNRENMMRGAAVFAFTGRCLAGLHEMTDENVYVYGNGRRACRRCKNERVARPVTCSICGETIRANSLPRHKRTKHRMLADAGLLAESAPVAGGNGAVSGEQSHPRPTTHETLDSLTARLVAARAATDGYRTEAERLRELLDEAHAKIERMEEL